MRTGGALEWMGYENGWGTKMEGVLEQRGYYKMEGVL